MVRNASNKVVVVNVLHLSVVRLAAAVHETLSPFMTEIKEGLAAVKVDIKEIVTENLTKIQQQVNFLTHGVVNFSKTVGKDVEEVKNQSKPQVVKELVRQGLLPYITILQQNLTENLTRIEQQVNFLNRSVANVSDTVSNLSRDVEEVKNQSKPEVVKRSVMDIILPRINILEQNIEEIKATVLENLTTIQQQVNFLNDSVAVFSVAMSVLSRDVEEVKNQSKPQIVKESVLQGILPHLNNLEQNLQEKVNESEESIHVLVDEQTAGVCDKLDTIQSLLISVNTNTSQYLSQIKTRLQEHGNLTASELARLETSHQTIDSRLDSLDSKQDGLNITVMTVNSELEYNVLTNVTKELKKTADYVLEHITLYECGGTGDWRRVVYLNMTDPNTNCPSGWNLTTYSKRTCGRATISSRTCDSVSFTVSGGEYNSVCGSIRAYQHGQMDGFEAYHNGPANTIEGPYVAGVSLTHGSPHQHIWTFAATASETRTNFEGCPCDGASVNIPPFVGEDYFCESGDTSGSPDGNFYPDDPLWDGDGCSNSSSCCSFNNPPYFIKQLPSPTSDPIEARLCRFDDGSDDSPVEFIELYVK